MGILNVTPDSFFDGGRHADVAAAVAHGLAMHAAGAAIIDVGGESTRPGAVEVSVAEELARVIPVIERLGKHAELLISVDTSRPEVIAAAAAAGAHMLNDVRALQCPGASAAAAVSGMAVCLMHMQGEPGSMQAAPHYLEPVTEIREYLRGRVAAAAAAGIAPDRLCIDPGLGFGKSLVHNLELLRRLPELNVLGLPILVGASRKAMLGRLTGREPGERLAGSVALATIAVMQGANIIRAHDVAETFDAVRVADAMRPVATN
jgi:dihydropteroate synthase